MLFICSLSIYWVYTVPGSGALKLGFLFLGCFGSRAKQIATSQCMCCEGRVKGTQERGEGLPQKTHELHPKSRELVTSSSECRSEGCFLQREQYLFRRLRQAVCSPQSNQTHCFETSDLVTPHLKTCEWLPISSPLKTKVIAVVYQTHWNLIWPWPPLSSGRLLLTALQPHWLLWALKYVNLGALVLALYAVWNALLRNPH